MEAEHGRQKSEAEKRRDDLVQAKVRELDISSKQVASLQEQLR